MFDDWTLLVEVIQEERSYKAQAVQVKTSLSLGELRGS